MLDSSYALIRCAANTAPDLRRSLSEPRALRSGLLTAGAWVVALIASVPLFSVLYMLIVEGGARLSTELFTELPPAGFELGGGFGNAIVGTLVMVGIAALISIPLGIIAAVFLAELGPNSKLAAASREPSARGVRLPHGGSHYGAGDRRAHHRRAA